MKLFEIQKHGRKAYVVVGVGRFDLIWSVILNKLWADLLALFSKK